MPVPVCNQFRLFATFLVAIAFHGFVDTNSTSSPNRFSGTGPHMELVLPSYEGQNVVSIELAGRH
jgi:hypothetical protein